MRTSRRGPTSEKRPRQGQPKTAPGRSLPARAVPPHDDLDAAVAAAYGWLADPTDQEILERIVALNAARAAEEAKGKIRWLRPEFQNPSAPGGAPSPEPANANAARRPIPPRPRPRQSFQLPAPCSPLAGQAHLAQGAPRSGRGRRRRPPRRLGADDRRRTRRHFRARKKGDRRRNPQSPRRPRPRPPRRQTRHLRRSLRRRLGRARPPGAPRRSGGFRFPQVSAAGPAIPPYRQSLL